LLLVEEDAAERERLRSWLVRSGYEVYAAADGAEAILLLKQHPIEVVITHLRLPGLNGIELLSRVKEFDPQIEVIILSDSCTVEDTLGALRGRAFDFLQTPLTDLQHLNRVIAEALLQRCLGGRMPRPLPPRRTTPSLAEDLTPREKQVLSLLAMGWDNRAIAKRLCLGEKTVRNLLSGIYAKLGVVNRTQAVLQFQQRGYAGYILTPLPSNSDGKVSGEAS
jgi:DNA-binding NarL/FixJ family response regulator